MFSKKKKDVTKGIKKVDAVITGLILGGILASVYGVKKYEEQHHKEEEKKVDIKESKKSNFLKQIFLGDNEQEQKDSLLKTVFKIILKNFLGKK